MSAANRLAVSVIVHDRATDRIATVHYGKRSWTPGPAWTIPGGKVEAGEEIDVAAARELREETSLVVAPADLRLVHTVQVKEGWDGLGQFLLFVFATGEFTGELVNAEPAKHLAVRWAPAGALPGPMFPSSRSALEAYLSAGPAFATYGFDGSPDYYRLVE
ncbi:NUDIX domain-containing protein [Kitasatospora sp. NRRL B-11411]|uniref:NUDIX domain-containing protein n=1 Tax=Kitasatospora sp. NRRL B-11411 TaxID=1463822 RepID=UPI0004C3A60C|nr:NUDIX domain-containing protein [Kitasatospora sp. NRRL B-11411]